MDDHFLLVIVAIIVNLVFGLLSHILQKEDKEYNIIAAFLLISAFGVLRFVYVLYTISPAHKKVLQMREELEQW